MATVATPLAGRRDPLWPVVSFSALVHVGAIVFAILYKGSAPLIDLSQKPIIAKLVRLGEKRDEKFLPRKEAEAPPAPAAAAVPIPGAKTAPPPGKEAAPAKKDPLASALARIRRDQIFSKDGDPSG